MRVARSDVCTCKAFVVRGDRGGVSLVLEHDDVATDGRSAGLAREDGREREECENER
jgi:hypothetical protein